MRHLISLGCRCDVAFQLRMHGAENVAHFFDWLATPAEGVIKIIEADFDVFHPDHLLHNTKHKPHCVEDALTGVMFHHQFPMFAGNVAPNFLLFYEPFIQKFHYLAGKFRTYLQTRPVTLVRQDITEEQALRLEQAVATRFPEADVRFLYVLNSGTVFQTPLGHARLLKNDWSSLGDPAEWATMLVEEGLTKTPYRHATAEILGASHDDHNLLPDNRFSETQLLAAIDANPNNHIFLQELSRYYRSKHRFGEAELQALRSLALAPESTECKFELALCRLNSGKITDSEAADLFIALAEKASLNDLPYHAAKCLLQANRFVEALDYSARAIKRNSTNDNAYYVRTMTFYQIKDLVAAERVIRVAINLQPKRELYHHMHARFLDELGRFEDAIAAEQNALNNNSGWFQSLAHLGWLYKKLGRHAEAISAWERALPEAGENTEKVNGWINELQPRPVTTA